MSPALSAALALAIALACGVGVPFLAMKSFVPSLSTSPRALVRNYRGRMVFYGLGAVWLVWAGGAILGGSAIGWVLGDASVMPLIALAGALALSAFALGLLDDAYGTPDARGFRGHLLELAGGRVTTGLLKLLGIGLASLAVSWAIAAVAPWGLPRAGAAWDGPTALFTAIAGAAIALTSNLVNLLDLRPGRALKAYALLGLAGCVSPLMLLGAIVGGTVRADIVVLDLLALATFVAGPLIAVWRYDLGEQGMLGDAGANAMGAVAGFLVVSGLPRALLVAYAAAVLALNLLSEHVSFSAVIDRTTWLARLDVLGRTVEPVDSPVPGSGPDGTDGAAVSRYDATDDHDSGEA